MHKNILIVVGITILFLGISIIPPTGNISKASFICKSNNPPYEPSAPIPPDGAENWTDGGLCWTGGDPDGDQVTYDVYLGTTTPPPLVMANHTGTCYEPGTMNYSTKYYWQIVAWDEHGASTSGPIWSFTTSGKNHPPKALIIDGPPSGKAGVEYCITIHSIDPDGDEVLYYIDWGDGCYEEWFGPYESSVNVTKCHTYPPITKLYEIRVKAKDIYGAESDWGKMYVFIYRSRNQDNSFFLRFLERFQMLERLLSLLL